MLYGVPDKFTFMGKKFRVLDDLSKHMCAYDSDAMCYMEVYLRKPEKEDVKDD
jgi:hypothetical protein